MKVIIALKQVQRTKQLLQQVQSAIAEGNFDRCNGLIQEYLSDDRRSLMVTALVIPQWLAIIDCLNHVSLYHDALALAELAVQCTEMVNAIDEYAIIALCALGRTQMECQQETKALLTLEKAWDRLQRSPLYNNTGHMLTVGNELAYVCVRLNLLSRGQVILDKCRERVVKTDYYNKDIETALLIDMLYGHYCFVQNKYSDGTALCKKILSIIQAKKLEDSPVYYKALAMYGAFEKKLGHYVRYNELTLRAVTLAEERGDIQELQSYWNNLIDSYLLLGKWEQLLLTLNHTKTYLAKIGRAANSFNVCQMYMNVAVQYARNHMYDLANETCSYIDETFQDLLYNEDSHQSRELIKLHFLRAAVRFYSDPPEDAIHALKACQDKQEQVLGIDDVDTLQTRQFVIECLAKMGRFEQALVEAEQVLKLRLKSGQGNTVACGGTYQTLALQSYALSRPEDAFGYAQQFFRLLDTHVYQIFEQFDEKAWKGFTAGYHDFLHKLIGWAIVESDGTGRTHWLEQSRMKVLYSFVLKYKNILYDQEWGWKSRIYAGDQQASLNEYYQLLKQKQNYTESEEILEYIRRKISITTPLVDNNTQRLRFPISVDELLGRLDLETVIVDVVRYEANKNSSNSSETGYAAFILTHNGIKLFDWGLKTDLDGIVDDFLKYLSMYGADKDVINDRLALLRAMTDAESIVDINTNQKRIILNLDGGLLPRIPWQLVFPTRDVFVVPTFTSFEQSLSHDSHTTQQLIAFTAPLIGNHESVECPGAQIALRLTEPCLCSLKRSGKVLRAYTGSEATPEALAGVVSPEVLHIAAHGAYSEDRNEFQMSCFFLTGSGDMTQADEAAQGAVTILDIMQMDLRGTKLVVLESCESAKGQYKEDEGIYDFVRAFFIAGAEAVLSALWEVSAFFSCIFIDQFYRVYFSDQNAQKAFTVAQSIVRQMKMDDVKEWYMSIKCEIEQLENEEQICRSVENSIRQLVPDAEGYCFNKPVYWACYVLRTRHEFESALNRG